MVISLVSDLVFDRVKVLFECCIAKECDIIAVLAVILTQLLGLVLVWCEKNVLSCDNKQLLSIIGIGATGTLSTMFRLGTDGETENSGERFVDTYSSLGRVGGSKGIGPFGMGTDSRISTSTSVMPCSSRSALHREATMTPSLGGRDAGITPIQRMAGA